MTAQNLTEREVELLNQFKIAEDMLHRIAGGGAYPAGEYLARADKIIDTIKKFDPAFALKDGEARRREIYGPETGF